MMQKIIIMVKFVCLQLQRGRSRHVRRVRRRVHQQPGGVRGGAPAAGDAASHLHQVRYLRRPLRRHLHNFQQEHVGGHAGGRRRQRLHHGGRVHVLGNQHWCRRSRQNAQVGRLNFCTGGYNWSVRFDKKKNGIYARGRQKSVFVIF